MHVMKTRRLHHIVLGCLILVAGWLTCPALGQGSTPQNLSWAGSDHAILALDTPHPLTATASSGLPVGFRVDAGPATITAGTLNITGQGTLRVTAEQAGDGTFAAVHETRTFNERQAVFTPRGSIASAKITFGVDVAGDYAYMADWGAGLQIVDVSNPGIPVRAALFNTPGECFGVHVVDHLAYVADGSKGLQILDVSDPANPVRVGAFLTGGTAMKVQVVGTVAYVAALSADLQVIDVSDPTAPKRLAKVNLAGDAIGLKVVGNLAYVAAGGSGLHVLDVSNPASPVRLATLGGLGVVSSVDVAGNRACVVSSSGLEVLDVSTPAAPVRLAEMSLFIPGLGGGGVFIPGLPAIYGDVQIVDGLAYVVNFGNLQLIEFGDPTQPRRLGYLQGGGDGKGVRVAGSTVYVGDATAGLRVVNTRLAYPQTVTWTDNTVSIVPLDTPHPLGATASSGLPITVRVAAGPATLANGQLTVTGPGTVSVVAEQPGDAAYLPVHAARAFNVRQAQLSLVGLSPRPVAQGSATDLQVAGNLAYVTDQGLFDGTAFADGGLRILDVSQPGAPVQVGRYTSPGSLQAVRVAGSLAYLAAGPGGLEIVDVGNPANPRLLGSYAGSNLNAVWVTGDRAYATSSTEGLLVLDVSNPANPFLLGSVLVAQASAVEVSGNFAYVTTTAGQNGAIQVVDVSDPAAPVAGARITPTGYLRGLHIAGNHAYVAVISLTTPVEVFDLSQPANPVRVGGIDSSEVSGYSMDVADSHLFSDTSSNGISVFDVSNPAEPLPVGRVALPSGATALRAVGHTLYALTYQGLLILELRLGYPQTLVWSGADGPIPTLHTAHPLGAIANSGLPVTLRVEFGPATLADGKLTLSAAGLVQVTAEQPGDATYLPVHETRGFNGRQATLSLRGGLSSNGDAQVVRVVGNRAYVGDQGTGAKRGLRILDVSDPTHPVQLGFLRMSARIYAVQVVGNLAYLADPGNDDGDGGGLRVVDVSDPTRPTLAGGITTDAGASDVQVAGSMAYVAHGGSLRVYDVGNPANPVPMGRLDMPAGGAWNVRVVGNHAYIGEGLGLAVVDVSNPASPVRVGRAGTFDYIDGLEVVGSHAYLVSAVGNGGYLEVVDVSQPDRPVTVGHLALTSNAAQVRVVDNTAYVTAWNGGLQVVDVTNPAVPMLLGSIATLDSAAAVDVAGNLAYVAAASAGLQIIEVRLSTPQVALPGLRVGAVGRQLEMAWPAALAGAKLQHRESFAPEHAWQDVPAALVEVNGEVRVNLEAVGNAGYFRLFLP